MVLTARTATSQVRIRLWNSASQKMPIACSTSTRVVARWKASCVRPSTVPRTREYKTYAGMMMRNSKSVRAIPRSGNHHHERACLEGRATSRSPTMFPLYPNHLLDRPLHYVNDTVDLLWRYDKRRRQ